jgi:CRP/FNR family transcriptional regulator
MDMKAAAKKEDTLFGFSEAQMRELELDAVPHQFDKGQPIWHAGEEPDAIWVVKSGRVNMCIESAEGNASIVQFCTKAQAFCPAAAIAGRPCPCSAMAATEVQAVAIPRAKFMKVFEKLPTLAKDLLKQMAPQFCEAHAQQAEAMAPVRSRLASLLSRLNERFRGAEIPFTRQELANMSGTTVETTIRTLSQWEKDGVIRSERGSIHIKDLDELAGVAA